MKKRILSILLLCCMVLTMLPTAAFAAVSDSLGNTPEENQAILEQLSALTGGSSDQVLSMLNALGLLDEDGNFKVDQTITLDGQVLTLAAVMELLENPATDLTRIADVDGTPEDHDPNRTGAAADQGHLFLRQGVYRGSTGESQ